MPSLPHFLASRDNMRPSTLFLVAPFPLFSAAWALPKSLVDLGPGEEVEIQCQGVTVTETKWLPSPTSASGTQGGGQPPGEPLPSASTSPDATQSVVVVAENETASFSNTTVKATSGYRNALYFTNWLVTYMYDTRSTALTISGAFMAPTRSLKSYPPTRSRMCSTPLPTSRLMGRCK